jgi:hypothetical protein
MRAQVSNDELRRAALFAIVAIAVAVAAGPARADIIADPPTDCPAGTVGSNECVPHCQVIACANDGDCDQGRTCQAVSMCMADIKCERGEGRPVRAALPTWGRASICDQGTPEQVMVCIDQAAAQPGALAAGTHSQTAGLARGPTTTQVGATVLLLASLGAVVIIRRRQGSPS